MWNHSDLVLFAEKHKLSPKEAVVLPALFEKAAKVGGMSPEALARDAAWNGGELAEYLAGVARKAAKSLELSNA